MHVLKHNATASAYLFNCVRVELPGWLRTFTPIYCIGEMQDRKQKEKLAELRKIARPDVHER